MTAPGQVLRHVFIRGEEAPRPNRWAVLVLAALTELVVLSSLGLVHGEDAAVAVAVSFMVLTAVAAGTLAGPLVGAIVALVGGATFHTTVAHFGADQSFLATAISRAVWMLAAILSGIIAEALREQVTEPLRSTSDLQGKRPSKTLRETPETPVCNHSAMQDVCVQMGAAWIDRCLV